MKRPLLSFFLLLLVLLPVARGAEHFEGRQTHPVDVTPDGAWLLAVNTADGRLCIHSLADPDRPVLVREVPVGREPVSVRVRNASEAWVVNEASDTIAIVDPQTGRLLHLLEASDEPADVVFAAGKAFVSCARNRRVLVFNADDKSMLGSIPLDGIEPRALAATADGSTVYAAFLYSGNRTTVLPASQAPEQPLPTNPALPAPPRTALIVPDTHPSVTFTVRDHDVAEIDAATLSVNRYHTDIGTNLLDLAVRPTDGRLLITHSDSGNLTRFEPELRGRFSTHRVTMLDPAPGGVRISHDLNQGIDPAIQPNPPAIQTALAQPTGIRISADGTTAWICAFNSDRIARWDLATGTVTGRLDLRATGEPTSAMRGPRGLALHPSLSRAYIANRMSGTITAVDTDALSILSETATGSNDPHTEAVKNGRRFFNDARLSGNGTVSCATCHIDADRDGLAWDLGDPGGDMVVVKGAALSAHITRVRDRVLHPMKGPMVTQTLRGLASVDADPSELTTQPDPQVITTKFHWRGDKPSIQSFNSTFPNLLGGPEIPAADMDDLAEYLLSIRVAPNPNLEPDRSLRTDLDGANPVRGKALFLDHLASHCLTCHSLPAGTDQNIDLMTEVGGTQPVKNPSLRTSWMRAGLFDNSPGASSLSGFGLGSDGTQRGFPISHPYPLSELSEPADLADLAAFILSFDTGTAPAATFTVLMTAGVTSPDDLASIAVLEAAPAADADLVVNGSIRGLQRSWLFSKSTGLYHSGNPSDAPLTRAQLLALLHADDSLVFSGTPPGTGSRASIDRNGNGIPDAVEKAPALVIAKSPAGNPRLSWPVDATGWHVQTSTNLEPGSWEHFATPPDRVGESFLVPLDPGPPGETSERSRFFRLHRTW